MILASDAFDHSMLVSITFLAVAFYVLLNQYFGLREIWRGRSRVMEGLSESERKLALSECENVSLARKVDLLCEDSFRIERGTLEVSELLNEERTRREERIKRAEALEHEFADLESRLRRSRREMDDLGSRVSFREGELDELRRECSQRKLELERELNGLNEKVKRCEERTWKDEKKCEDHEMAMVSLIGDLGRFEPLAAEIDNLASSCEFVSATRLDSLLLDPLEGQMSEFVGAIEEFKRAVDGKVMVNSLVDSIRSLAEADCGRLRREMDGNKSRVEQLESEIAHSEDELLRTNEQTKMEMRSREDETRAHYELVLQREQQRILKEKNEMDRLRQIENTQIVELAQVERDLKALQHQNQSLKSKIELLTIQRTELENERESLKRNVKGLTHKVQRPSSVPLSQLSSRFVQRNQSPLVNSISPFRGVLVRLPDEMQQTHESESGSEDDD